jgi:hypothetical protein
MFAPKKNKRTNKWHCYEELWKRNTWKPRKFIAERSLLKCLGKRGKIRKIWLRRKDKRCFSGFRGLYLNDSICYCRKYIYFPVSKLQCKMTPPPPVLFVTLPPKYLPVHRDFSLDHVDTAPLSARSCNIKSLYSAHRDFELQNLYRASSVGTRDLIRCGPPRLDCS